MTSTRIPALAAAACLGTASLGVAACGSDTGTSQAGSGGGKTLIKDRRSVLGTYSIDENGDTTLKSYGGNRVESGAFVFDKIINL